MSERIKLKFRDGEDKANFERIFGFKVQASYAEVFPGWYLRNRNKLREWRPSIHPNLFSKHEKMREEIEGRNNNDS